MSLELLSFLLRTGAVGVLALPLILFLRRRSAATQHAFVASALIAILVLVPASFVVTHRVAPVYSTPVSIDTVSLSVSSEKAEAIPTIQGFSVEKVAAGNPFRLDPVSSFVSLWVLVAGVFAARLLYGLVVLGVRVRGSEPVSLRPGVRTLVDEQAVVPLAVWWGRPMVLLPPSWSSWSAERLETVLQHEVAHLDRGDCWVQLAGSIACAVAWPNPFAWWLASKARSLSELAVDDLILASGVSPTQYAQDLLDIARQSRDRISGLALPMALTPEVSRRIEMILSDRKQRGSVTLAAIVAMGLGFGGLAIAASSWGLVPKLTHLDGLTLSEPQLKIGLASSSVEPAFRIGTELGGTSWAHLAPSIEPRLPEVSSEVVSPTPDSSTPSTSSSPQDPRFYSAVGEMYHVDPKADLSSVGIHIEPKHVGGVASLSAEQVRDLRKLLSDLGDKVQRHSKFRALNGETSTVTWEEGEVRRLLWLKFRKTASLKFGSLFIHVGSNRKADSKYAGITFRGPDLFQGQSCAFWMPVDDSRNQFEVWIFDKFVTPTVVEAEKSMTHFMRPEDAAGVLNPNPIQVIVRLRVLSVPAWGDHASELTLDPTGKQKLRETDLNEEQLASFEKELEARDAWVIEAPVVRSLDGRPVFFSYGSGQVERQMKVTLFRDRTLDWETSDAEVSYRPDGSQITPFSKHGPVDKSRNIFRGPIAIGSSRVVIGKPDPKTKATPVWIVNADLIDQDDHVIGR